MTCLFLIATISCSTTVNRQDEQSEPPISSNVTSANAEVLSPLSGDQIDDAFKTNYHLWSQVGSNDYTLTLGYVNSGAVPAASPVKIIVRDGKAVSINAVSATDKRTLEFYKGRSTIQDIFNEILRWKNTGGKSIVEYDKKYGYPQKAQIFTGGNSFFMITVDKLAFDKNR